jgi:hypothetical protein
VRLAVALLLVSCVSEAPPPGCTAADFDTLARDCPTDQCDRLIGDREARCRDAVELE